MNDNPVFRPRQLAPRLLRLLEVFPVVVLVGARQVGKSTLVERMLVPSGWSMVVLDPVVDVENARADSDLFLQNRPPPLVVDEVQYAPELVAALKRRVDRDRRPGMYVLTGSQQWGVLRNMAESLAGRAAFLDLEGFSLQERAGEGTGRPWLGAWLAHGPALLDRSLRRVGLREPIYEILWRGSLPAATMVPLDVVPDLLAGYRRTYIERDVRLLSDPADLQLFGRFFQLCAALTAQEENRSQLGREVGIAGPTARRWLDLLVATFQWHHVPAWHGSTVKRVSGRPKGYFGDTGLACLAQAISSPTALAGHPLVGALFETAVVAELRRQCALLPMRPNLWHWRSHRGGEVDVVVELDGRLHPVEVRLTSRPGRRDTSGLAAFRETYGSVVGPGLVLAPIERALRLGDRDVALPWDLAGMDEPGEPAPGHLSPQDRRS